MALFSVMLAARARRARGERRGAASRPASVSRIDRVRAGRVRAGRLGAGRVWVGWVRTDMLPLTKGRSGKPAGHRWLRLVCPRHYAAGMAWPGAAIAGTGLPVDQDLHHEPPAPLPRAAGSHPGETAAWSVTERSIRAGTPT